VLSKVSQFCGNFEEPADIVVEAVTRFVAALRRGAHRFDTSEHLLGFYRKTAYSVAIDQLRRRTPKIADDVFERFREWLRSPEGQRALNRACCNPDDRSGVNRVLDLVERSRSGRGFLQESDATVASLLTEVKLWLLTYAGILEVDLMFEKDDGTREAVEIPDLDANSRPENAVELAEAQRLVTAAVNGWTPEQQTIFMLRVRGVPARLVADIINERNPDRNPPLTAQNVDVIYHRCRRRLRRELCEHPYFRGHLSGTSD